MQDGGVQINRLSDKIDQVNDRLANVCVLLGKIEERVENIDPIPLEQFNELKADMRRTKKFTAVVLVALIMTGGHENIKNILQFLF